ncbi:hypothetical protein HQQ94_21820 [Shewanella sp. VB17]|uniref:hypothetical protein n=1 Tax=Shewanella sp. VB17 TaxID=2739432 RepID=UPI0015653883|nr:hypothetical protein [Shewanella sp. VB17]NRD75805.1 hypothetical protein [Shewanella sp. VB17]
MAHFTQYKTLLCCLVVFSLPSLSMDSCQFTSISSNNNSNWLESINQEFSGFTASSNYEDIPSLLLGTTNESSLPKQWQLTEQIFTRGPNPDALTPIANEQLTGIKQLLGAYYPSERFLVALGGLNLVADVAILTSWFVDVITAFEDESSSNIHLLATFFSIVPIIGDNLGYYDYLSQIKTSTYIVNKINNLEHYSYNISIPELASLSSEQSKLLTHYQQFQQHIETQFQRLADIQILHQDSLYRAKVMEYEHVLDNQFTHFDHEYFKTSLWIINSRPNDTFGFAHCQNELINVNEITTNFRLYTTVNINERIAALRLCQYDNIILALQSLWYKQSNPTLVEARNSLYLADSRLVDITTLHLSQAREIYQEKLLLNLQQTREQLLSQPSIMQYQQQLYTKARYNAITEFSLTYFKRLPNAEELYTGEFWFGEDEWICGLYTCNIYDNRKRIKFIESQDSTLNTMKQDIITIDIHAYLANKIAQGWSEQELMDPLKNLWNQWISRHQQHMSDRPYKGNISLRQTLEQFPKLHEILLTINESISDDAAVDKLTLQMYQSIGTNDFSLAWDDFGDFMFPVLYQLHQSQTENMLPLLWQKKIWENTQHGMLFNAMLSKPYLYLSSAQWAKELPGHEARTQNSLWYLYQGQTDVTYLTQSSNIDINDNVYWKTILSQLAFIADSPELRWKPTIRKILLNNFDQLNEAQALITFVQETMNKKQE